MKTENVNSIIENDDRREEYDGQQFAGESRSEEASRELGCGLSVSAGLLQRHDHSWL